MADGTPDACDGSMQLIAAYCVTLRHIAVYCDVLLMNISLLEPLGICYGLLQLIAAHYSLLRRIAGREAAGAARRIGGGAGGGGGAGQGGGAAAARAGRDGAAPQQGLSAACCGSFRRELLRRRRRARRDGAGPWCEVLRLLHPVRTLVTLTLLLIAAQCSLLQHVAHYRGRFTEFVGPFAALSAAYCSSVQRTAAYCILSCGSLHPSLLRRTQYSLLQLSAAYCNMLQ